MAFFGYLLLGAIAYGLGWGVNNYVLRPSSDHRPTKPKPYKLKNEPASQPYNFKHPTILIYLAGFFIGMLIISGLIGYFILNHERIDIPYIIVNSLAATLVFYFGLCPDKKLYDVPK